MRFHILGVALMASALAGCFDVKNMPDANFKFYDSTIAQAPDSATINGFYTDGDNLWGDPSRRLMIAGIDGNIGVVKEGRNAPLIVSPGLHSMAVKYCRVDCTITPVTFVAKANAHYAISVEDGKFNWNPLDSGTNPNLISIRDEKTGEIVVNKVPDQRGRASDYYQFPAASPQNATMQGMEWEDGAILYLEAVDGKYVEGASSMWESSKGKPRIYDQKVPLTPGTHAISIKYDLGTDTPVSYPLVFEVRAGATYAIKTRMRVNSKMGTKMWIAAPVWIEDEKGQIVVPVSNLPALYIPLI